MRRVLFAVPALVAALAVSLPGAAAAAPAQHSTPAPARPHAKVTHAPGSFVPIAQFRAVATRSPLAAGHRLTVALAGRHGVPSNAAAVAITVHAIAPSRAGALAVVPHGASSTKSLAVSYWRGQGSAQPTVARLAHGAIDIVNRARSGSTRVAVDVAGYYVGGRVGRSQPGELHALSAPTRALDTRSGAPIRANGVRTFRVGHGVPSSGVGAVAVALTVFSPARGGGLVAYANGNDRPSLPSASFAAHRSSTTFAWVPTDNSGSISIANTAGRAVDIAVDVVAWTDAGVARTAGALQPRYQDRLVDHRPVLAGRTTTVRVDGSGGVPQSQVRAAVVELTASAATRAGSLAAWPDGAMPATRVLDYQPNRTDSVVVQLPLSGGALRVHNVSHGSVELTADIVGFVPADTLTPPPTSISRYLGDLTGDDATDVQKMHEHGCTDAQTMQRAGSRFVLLDVGAQSITGPELSATDPGVSVTQTVSTVRLTYPELRDRLQSYLDAFANCGNGERVTIAVGTNNDGAWDPTGDNYYSPEQRAADWAGSVVNLLGSNPGITLVGANDIEPGFAGSQAQALTWEQTYLDAADTKQLVFNGSADGCPDGFGQTSPVCSRDYTQKGLYRLATLDGQVTAVPQIYGPSMAAQWANINRVGGGGIDFGGVLTEHALNSVQYTPDNGWTALYYALASDSPAPYLPAVSDITNPSP